MIPMPQTYSSIARAVMTFVAVAAAAGAAYALGGKQEGGGDWPCPQRKVATLGASDLQWEGAPVDPGTWRKDEAAITLVKQLANRRLPLDEAIKELKSYAAKIPAADRTTRLSVVFSGLLETVNDYRLSVINGIERFNKRQRARATEIEDEGLKLAGLQKKAESAPNDQAAKAEYDKATELYEWNTRVFEERRQNLPLACEIPPAIDSRMFEIVREMKQLLGQAG